MADTPRHLAGMHDHPDVWEMGDRYTRILAGGRAAVVDGLVLLAGLYLAISPWVVDVTAARDLTVNNLVLGIAVAVMGLGLASVPYRVYGMSWAVAAIGIWEIVTPWVVGPSSTPVLWNNLWVGGVIAALGLVGAGMRMAGTRTTRRETHPTRSVRA